MEVDIYFMKKTKLLLLSSLLVAGSLVSCGGNSNKEEEITFGFGYSTSFAESHGTWQLDATVVAAAFDKDGKVIDARADVTQVKFAVAAGETEGSYVVSATSGDKSKLELGTDYNMLGPSGIGKEVYEQIESWADWTVGKTASEIKGADGTNGECGSGVSISTNAFGAALDNAYSKKYSLKVSSTKDLKVGVGMVNGGVWEGEGSLYVAGALTDGSKVLTSYVDSLTYLPSSTDGTTVTLKTESYGSENKYTVNADEGQAIKSKRDLGALYGMAGSSPIGAEYDAQCLSLDTYFTGKTLSEAAAVASDAEISGVTITQDGIVNASKEAIAYSVKDVITDKPVSK